ncbi:unnamed protein product [Moneuplotes crassus]|uniref:Uncharacterized protein n=1 Tax=Euplotes crassus TaxID=5936 RepID=A0AAD1XAW7_EUPCR|nr:unnamed protein product [Moneuplotes crassus]
MNQQALENLCQFSEAVSPMITRSGTNKDIIQASIDSSAYFNSFSKGHLGQCFIPQE